MCFCNQSRLCGVLRGCNFWPSFDVGLADVSYKKKEIGRLRFARTKVRRDFQEKWVLGHGTGSEKLLGTGDIQSLADLGNSYAEVYDMRIVPFGLRDVSRLAAATAAPMVPLLLLVWSPEPAIMRVMKVVF